MIQQVISQSNISNNFTVTPISTNNTGHYSLLFPHAQYNPIMFYKNGYSVFATMDQREQDYAMTVYLYNHSTKALTSADWGLNPSGDFHSTATMRFLDDGRIIGFAPSDHNDVIDIKVSDNAYDISSFTTTTTITGGFPAYPNITQVGTRLYVFTRGFSRNNYITWSDNDGTTFTTPQKVLELANANKWAYPRSAYSTDKIRVGVMQRDQDSGGGWSNFYWLESSDGNTWTNLQGTFSKDVSSSGFITSAQMDANFLIENAGFVGSVVVKDTEEIMYHVDGAIKYTNNGSVVTVNLTHPNYTGFTVQNKSQILKVTEQKYNLICRAVFNGDGQQHLVLVQTSDLFQNITVTSLLKGDQYLTPNMAYNYEEGVEPLYIALDRKVYGSGDLIDPFNSYADFVYINDLNI